MREEIKEILDEMSRVDIMFAYEIDTFVDKICKLIKENDKRLLDTTDAIRINLAGECIVLERALEIAIDDPIGLYEQCNGDTKMTKEDFIKQAKREVK